MPTESPYFDAFDHRKLLEEYPIGEAFLQRFRNLSADELHSIQERRFLHLVEWGWRIGFYNRLWSAAGLSAGDITSLEDIQRLPVYSKSDLMQSVAEHPPLGDFCAPEGERLPMVMHTTSGTTGTPQPLIFGPKGREVQNLLLARAYKLQGLSAGAVVQSCYGHGMINGGHYVREAFLHYTDALFLSAGTGVETPSIKQVALMRDFGVNTLVGFADYIKKLAEVATQQGIVPGRDIDIKMISGHLGMESREALAQQWGNPELYDWYGVGDTGAIAAEGPDHQGLHIWEDAQYLELLDIEGAGAPVDWAAGEQGEMVVTCLYKDDAFPVIRFNTHDITHILPGESGLGLPFRRIAGFRGRSDNMVKLRGINIYPHAIGSILEGAEGYAGEYVCLVERDASGRDEMIVQVEVNAQPAGADEQLQSVYAERLRNGIGIAVQVSLVAQGGTAPLTEIDSRQKPIRLVDRRNLEGSGK